MPGYLHLVPLLSLLLVAWGGIGLLPVPAHAAPPTAQEFTTKQGLRVLLVENHTNPVVDIRVMVPAGSANDPADKPGVAALVAWMFNEGAGNLASGPLHERLDALGIQMNAHVSRTHIAIHTKTLTRHLAEAWTILADALYRPRFDTEPWQRAVQSQKADLARALEDPDERASQALYRQLYPNHPYGSPVDGTEASLSRIELADLTAFRQRWFHPEGTVMVVVGDVDASQIMTLLHMFTPTEYGTPPAPETTAPDSSVPPGPEPAPAAVHIPMTISQTSVLLGTVGIDRQDPDYYPLLVTDHILGGSELTSRLGDVIREQRGLAYSIASHFTPLTRDCSRIPGCTQRGGPFIIAWRTRNAAVQESVALVRQELERMVRDGVTDAELQDARDYLLGSFAIRFDTMSHVASVWSAIGLYRLGNDYLVQWPKRIAAVTREDVQRVAQRLLQPDRFTLVTVGGDP